MFRAIAAAAGLAMLLTAALAGKAHAQEPEAGDCDDPFYQAQINMCARADHAAADKDMTAVYEQVLAQLREQDSSYAENGPEYVGAEKLLVESQEGWVNSRNDFCAARGSTFYGGSMRPAVVSSCFAMLTRSRTEELRWLLD